VKAVADNLNERPPILNEGGQDRRVAVIERRHPIERVRQGSNPSPIAKHPLAVARAGMARGADDAVLQKDAQGVRAAPSISGAIVTSRHAPLQASTISCACEALLKGAIS